jgi:curved DNA-binding protein CbpA
MDIQKALKLLDLDPGATLEDARAAFKKKAKQFHPDKLMAASKTGDDGEKMKDINVAYHTLKPVLKPAPGTQKSRLLPERMPLVCRRLVDTVRKWMFARPGPSEPVPRTASEQPRTWPHPEHPTGTRPPSPETFEDVLKQSLKRRTAQGKKFSAYARYLDLERKMKQARSRNTAASLDVESVEPVTRIKPVK